MKTYSGLRLLINQFRLFAWLLFVGGILLACALVAGPLLTKGSGPGSHFLIGVLASLGVLTVAPIVVRAIFSAAALLFAAAVLELLLDIELNTYEVIEHLQRPPLEPSQAQPSRLPSSPGAALPPGYKCL
jgi:hypothetical protein